MESDQVKRGMSDDRGSENESPVVGGLDGKVRMLRGRGRDAVLPETGSALALAR